MSQLKIKDGNNWVNIPASGVGVPSGGTTGQVLQKSSNTDYATGWTDLSLAWKRFASVTGKSVVTLPSSFNELLVTFSFLLSGQYPFDFSIIIPAADAVSGRRFITGTDSGDGRYFLSVQFDSNTQMHMQDNYIYNGDKSSETTVNYYYR